MAKCCMCGRHIERDDAPVLAMGVAGNPRLLCDECAALLDTATLGENIEDIKASMERIGNLMADGNPDGVTYSIVSELMVAASDRAKAIKDGNYDFSLDGAEQTDEGFEEIPEELLETEEDRERDRRDEEKNKRFDKFYNYTLIGACIALGLFIGWKVLEAFGVDFSQFFNA